jgi:hypothetical protein
MYPKISSRTLGQMRYVKMESDGEGGQLGVKI